jgi:hypothetical protein
VSDGRSHLIDLTVDAQAVGANGSELRLPAAGTVRVAVQVAALLDPVANEKVRSSSYDQQPYWDVERARIGTTREVPVELIVNGRPAARQTILADGQLRPVTFEVPIKKSSWLAVLTQQPGIRDGRRAAHPGLAPQRALVPRRGRSVLDAEASADPRVRARSGPAGLRPRAGGLPAARRRVGRRIDY